MEKINSNKFWKGIKKARKTRYICTAIFVVIAIILGIIGFIESKRVILLEDISNTQEIGANEHVYIDVVKKQFKFIEGDYISLYFVWDKNGKLYLVDLLPSLAKKLESATVDNPIRIIGTTKKITNEDRDEAIKIYNSYKNLDMEALTVNNFSDNVGNVYIYTKEKLTNEMVFYFIAGIFIAFAIPFAIAIIFIENKIKRTLKNLSPEEADLISVEVENEGTIIYEKVNVFLTENYVISLGKSIDITKYSDIVWVYHTDLRQSGVLSNRYINIITNEFKDRSIPIVPYGKSRNVHLEIMDIIAGKNSNILVGYTKENVETMKEAKKEYKRSKGSETDI
ncbi:MAG: hypothetical protein FWF46_01680 [Oscillospiraceae bacterium]|nr:hypothetical protein [Oscillospiraceae bacterium]